MRVNAKYKPQFVAGDLVDSLTKPQWADVAHKLAGLLATAANDPSVTADSLLAETIKEINPQKEKRAYKRKEKPAEQPAEASAD